MAERDFWAENLQPASFAGVAFPIGPRQIAGGRSWAKHRFAFRDGQDDEDTGREPYVFELEIPLFRSVDPSHYPDLFEALRFAFDDPDTKGRAEYVDPELGPVMCKVDKWSWAADPQSRNGGVFKVRLEEVSADPFVYTTARSSEPITDPADAADLADAELSEIGVTSGESVDAMDAAGVGFEDPSIVEEGGAVLAVVNDAIATITDAAADAGEIAAALETALQRIDAIANLDAVGDVDGAEAFGLLVEVGSALASAADRAVRTAEIVAEVTLEAPASSAEIALRLYGDASRAEEIERRNPTFCALLYGAGAVLSVAAT